MKKRSQAIFTIVSTALSLISCSHSGRAPMMEDIFESKLMEDEIVMFLDYGQEKQLLFDADEILSVRSFDNATTYSEGIDYALVDGKIKILEGSSMPCITSENYYDGLVGGLKGLIRTMHDGREVSVFWGEDHYMADWQVKVSYRHSDAWEGFRQPSCSDQFSRLLKKMKKGEDITVLYYGDSITKGCSSSYEYSYAPFQHSWPMLITESLAADYGYTVVFTDVNETLKNTAHVPDSPIEYGKRGTIRYVNTAVAGWNSGDGVKHFDEYIAEYVKKYGCDLFVLAYGMNDTNIEVPVTIDAIRQINDRVIGLSPDVSLLIVSTMLPNPTASNGWFGNQQFQEPELLKLAEEYQGQGQECAVARMTSVSEAVLTRKEFMDISGNNINHPNDFLGRVYAQTVLRTITGH